MRKLLLLTSFFYLGLQSLKAQEPLHTTPDQPYITVTGSAEQEIVPDEIYISFHIKEREEGREMQTIEMQENKLKEILQSLNIPIENLSLADANANYIRIKWTKKDVISRAEYVLKVKDATELGAVFEKFDELKIEDAYILRVSHSKIETFKKEVRIMAIKAAKEKADYLLTAIGSETGKPIEVYELKDQSLNFRLEDQYLLRGNRSGGTTYHVDGIKGGKVIQFQKIKLQAQIFVRFAIK